MRPSIHPSCRISKVVEHPRLSITPCSGLPVIANKFSPSVHADLGAPSEIQTNDADVVAASTPFPQENDNCDVNEAAVEQRERSPDYNGL